MYRNGLVLNAKHNKFIKPDDAAPLPLRDADIGSVVAMDHDEFSGRIVDSGGVDCERIMCRALRVRPVLGSFEVVEVEGVDSEIVVAEAKLVTESPPKTKGTRPSPKASEDIYFLDDLIATAKATKQRGRETTSRTSSRAAPTSRSSPATASTSSTSLASMPIMEEMVAILCDDQEEANEMMALMNEGELAAHEAEDEAIEFDEDGDNNDLPPTFSGEMSSATREASAGASSIGASPSAASSAPPATSTGSASTSAAFSSTSAAAASSVTPVAPPPAPMANADAGDIDFVAVLQACGLALASNSRDLVHATTLKPVANVHRIERSIKTTCRCHKGCVLWVNLSRTSALPVLRDSYRWAARGLELDATSHASEADAIKVQHGMQLRKPKV